ncbi:MAG TPA: nuclear transport factor 2 family protein [Pyrinomonadaceae bacterium]|nr:nuclear transport factor 2 family protein [Pyrinomonadaceae bacterium]
MEGAPQQSHIETEQLLRQMNDEWVKALVRRDSATLDRIMADDFVFIYPMEGDDKKTFIDDVVAGGLNVQQLTRANVTVRIWGHTAVLSALDTATWFYQGRDFSGQYKIVHIYANRDEEWKLVAVQACPIT